MLQVEYKLKLGNEEFTIKAEVKNEVEFFEKISFYSGLPKVGPNGENDLKITHRKTKSGDNYYSLVSKAADKEFKFGIHKVGGGLFPKNWEPLYHGENEANEDGASGQLQAPPLQQRAPAPQMQAPQLQAPRVSAPVQTPAPVPQVQTPQLQVPQIQQPLQAPAAQAPVAPTSPKVQQATTNVLARFGIQQKQ